MQIGILLATTQLVYGPENKLCLQIYESTVWVGLCTAIKFYTSIFVDAKSVFFEIQIKRLTVAWCAILAITMWQAK